MKSIFLSVVVICALAIAGIGGTFATWSDSEVSYDNEIVTGSVDLKVQDADDEPWGSGVPAVVKIDCMVPCRWYGPYTVDLWNAGICDTASHAFIHFKQGCCSNADPKEGSGYRDPQTGAMKPEPELVAEYGGKVDCTKVPGIGVTGDNCSMLSHVEVMIYDEAGNCIVRPTKLIDIWCDEIYLCDLVPCQPTKIYLYFHLIQETEEMYGYNFFPSPEELGYAPEDPEYYQAWLTWIKFNDWPSYAVMRDKVVFNIEFDLLLYDVPQ